MDSFSQNWLPWRRFTTAGQILDGIEWRRNFDCGCGGKRRILRRASVAVRRRLATAALWDRIWLCSDDAS
ncbi:hypothetical protein CASFOL_011247 [Castilleja foliolosa]|uniref:Uncharacterized protein n=1 Tax=Castilleja foliolosa TaxID=1961234 RepID=A0ABD3DWX3_9LAMI